MAAQEWTVRLVFATGAGLREETLDSLADYAESWDGTVANRAEGVGFAVTVDLVAESPVQAIDVAITWAAKGISTCGDVTDPELVDARVCDPDIYEAQAHKPDTPQLASAADAATILGVTRQRVHQLMTEHPRFPAPYARLATGPIWTVPTIEHFRDTWDRKPGRRRIAAAAGEASSAVGA